MLRKRRYRRWALGVMMAAVMTIAHLPQPVAAAESEPESDDNAARVILERADKIRFPREGFQVDVSINTTANNRAMDARKYRILSKGNDNAVVMIVEPEADRGQIMLMKSRDLWIYMPSVSQPVRLSMGQRLTGQVANGDLARSNFTGDYTPKVLRTDVIDGEKYYVLELNAVDRSVTYNKVVYWVRQSNFWPHRAEFYSLSNRLLKSCLYENYRMVLGAMRPTRLVMQDALRQGEESVLEYSSMKLRDLPDRVFTKEYLNRLQ